MLVTRLTRSRSIGQGQGQELDNIVYFLLHEDEVALLGSVLIDIKMYIKTMMRERSISSKSGSYNFPLLLLLLLILSRSPRLPGL